MGLFDKIFGKPQSQSTDPNEKTPAMVLFGVNVKSATEIFDEDERTKGGVLEALLLISIHTLKNVKVEKPRIYPLFEKQYFRLIERYALAEGLMDLIDSDYSEFVNNRFQLYGKMSKDSDHQTMSIIVYNIFENPLQLEGGFCTNPIEMLLGMQKIVSCIGLTDDMRKFVYKKLGL